MHISVGFQHITTQIQRLTVREGAVGLVLLPDRVLERRDLGGGVPGLALQTPERVPAVVPATVPPATVPRDRMVVLLQVLIVRACCNKN